MSEIKRPFDHLIQKTPAQFFENDNVRVTYRGFTRIEVSLEDLLKIAREKNIPFRGYKEDDSNLVYIFSDPSRMDPVFGLGGAAFVNVRQKGEESEVWVGIGGWSNMKNFQRLFMGAEHDLYSE